MKTIKIIILIIFIGLCAYSINPLLKYKKYSDINTGANVNEVREKLEKPSYTGTTDSVVFVDVYKVLYNKYVFIYSKKDSLLIKKWKEN